MTTGPVPGSREERYTRRVQEALGVRFRIERLVACSDERALFLAHDTVLNRRVSLRAILFAERDAFRWFLYEAVALGQLDHPAIRHAYDAGVVGDLAYRIGNWVEGESLHTAVQRGPRAFPDVLTLARDLLGALEHAHGHGIVVRRMVPASLLLNLAGRVTLTDLRFCSFTLPVIPAGTVPSGTAFMAPEVRHGEPGDPASDVYTVGAILYFALTGQEPPADPAAIRSPVEVRPTTPGTLQRIVMRALRPDPWDRYLTAAEMLEDLASEAGSFEAAGAGTVVPPDQTEGRRWEQRLRRALGDDYELLALLGAGGFGRVYRVRDLQLEREAALKVLHPSLTRDPAVVERFRREAQLAARLNHVNIVNIYDIGGRSGLIWYTMEMVEGPNLAQMVQREGPLPLDRVLRLLREALSALGHAHRSGLVHRDIKPENMLTEADGSLRITDFGLALALRGQGRFGGATSQSGTPQFASPEQLLGERVDQRSDLYSLAAVAYFALLGEAPFPGTTPEQVVALQTMNRFPDLARARPDVPAALRDVLDRALQNDVAARFTDADGFREALETAVSDDPARAPGDWARAAVRWFRG